MAEEADFGVFGGSGFYDLLEDPKEINVSTPYGDPSDKITLGTVKGKKVAFLPRHGLGHKLPPHKIPYKANIYAFKKLGVKSILAPCACGSLREEYKPGDFVVCDQFINFTQSRPNTYFDGPEVVHVSTADPYCPNLSSAATKAAKKINAKIWPKGTIVIIEGPRFSTRAESKFFRSIGGDVINMTAYPECLLARELNICYLNIALITDYDAGLETEEGTIKPVSAQEVLKVMAENNQKVKNLILKLIEDYDIKKDCGCHSATSEANS